MSDSTVYIFANPYSGSGENKLYVAELIEALAVFGLEGQAVWELSERKAILTDPRLAERCKTVVSAGGDGSLGDVVNELNEGGNLGQVSVAMLPMGNENLFAKEFGFSRDGKRLAEAIAKGACVQVDLGQIMNDGEGGKLFTLMLSSGFDAEVIRVLDHWREDKSAKGKDAKKRVTRMTYVPIILRTAFGYRFHEVELVTDDGVKERGCYAFAFVIDQYAGGLSIPKDVVVDDGLIDWVVFKKKGWLNVFRYMYLIWRGRHKQAKDVVCGRSKSVSIKAVDGEGDVPIQIDGDVGGFLPVYVETRGRELRVVDMSGVNGENVM